MGISFGGSAAAIGFRFLTGGHAVHGWENKRVSVAQETPMPPGCLNCKNPN